MHFMKYKIHLPPIQPKYDPLLYSHNHNVFQIIKPHNLPGLFQVHFSVEGSEKHLPLCSIHRDLSLKAKMTLLCTPRKKLKSHTHKNSTLV